MTATAREAAPGGGAPEAARTGRVHSWDLSTGVDGPGTRFVLFLSGCPLRCLYCHNPDTWQMRGGRTVTVREAAQEIARYQDFVRAAGGGVTLSGGEPLLQPAFTSALLRACKRLGLHTALDTSGFLGARADEELLAATDLVLLDVKSFDARRYRELTGGALAPTLRFAERLAALGKPVWIRYVLVPGWTDDTAEVDRLAGYLAALGNVERVDVLPFHKLGAAKYQVLGIPFPLADTPVPGPELVERVRGAFRAHGLRAW